MTAAVWQLDWRGNAVALFTPAAVAIVVLWWLVRCSKRVDAARKSDHDARWQALRDELEARRQATGWYQSQAYFDAECECIEIAERRRAQVLRSRAVHLSTPRHPKP